MTIFDLLFIAVSLAAIAALVAVAIYALRARGARALAILRRLAFCTLAYIGIVYAATAFGRQVVLRVGDPQCSDDWCLTVEGVRRTPRGAVTCYDISLLIFSRARRRAQREMIATDVYLVDAESTRYDPIPSGSAVPLNTLLQPGQSVTTGRTFELPAGTRGIGLFIGRRPITPMLPVCLVIGECGAFHKGTIVRIE